MTENQLILLIARQLSGELSEGEVNELTEWVSLHPDNQLLLDRISNEDQLEIELDLWHGINASDGHIRVISLLQAQRRTSIRRIMRWSIAASLLIAVGMIGLMRKPDRSIQMPSIISKTTTSISPGRNTAKLKLSNGREIELDSAGNGDLITQGSARLVKLDSGSLSYVVESDKNKTGSESYNTLTTPRSGQYQLRLPDGSHVWLNNVSSLRYPTSFQGKNRVVELTGEAYFEIAKDATKPFIVKVKGEEVEVLGTSFNIMAYPEEMGIQTTLLTGGVRVKAGSAAVLLKPDEQAEINEAGGLKVLKNVPSRDIASWKDGFFYFGRASFSAVMRQLARWYNVEVVYEGKVPDMEFGGRIDRSLPLSELLRFLDKNQVRFRLEGHNLIVLPY
jgi:transmembrane sensor